MNKGHKNPTQFSLLEGFLLHAGLFFFAIVLTQCSATRKLEEGQTLLVKNRIFLEGKETKAIEPYEYLKQRPLSKFFGLKKLIVVPDAILAKESAKQLQYYYKNTSYLDAEVTQEIVSVGKKTSEIHFHVSRGSSYTIDSISFASFAQDSAALQVLLDHPMADAPRVGEPYNYWKLNDLRKHIPTIYNANGYPHINKDLLVFQADTIGKNNQVSLAYTLLTAHDSLRPLLLKKHHFSTVEVLYYENQKRTLSNPDTLKYKNLTVYANPGKFPLKLETLYDNILTKKDTIYNRTLIDNSFSKLSTLQVFEQIRFNVKPQSDLSVKSILEMRKQPNYSTSTEAEGTHFSGNFGFSLRQNFVRRNVFRGGETLRAQVFASREFQVNAANIDNVELLQVLSYGANTSLRFPKFILPFYKPKRIWEYQSIASEISLQFDRFQNANYARTDFTGYLSYQWRKNGRILHTLNPLEINLINIDEGSDLSGFNLSDIARNFTNYITTSSHYSIQYSDQNPNKVEDHNFLYTKAEVSGNLLRTLGGITSWEENSRGSYEIFNTSFSQFVKLDVDFRHYFVLKPDHEFVTRNFFGIGYAYGNLNYMPLNKQYFIGGSSDLRAFPVLFSEPGSYANNDMLNYSSDLKIEFNMEYRFPISGAFKGALFYDMGNIWDLQANRLSNGQLQRPGALFDISTFYKDIYMGTGFGMRYDNDLFVFRLDLAYPVYDPTVGVPNASYDPEIIGSQPFLNAPFQDRWIIDNAFDFRSIQFNIGIGYPF